MSNNELWQSQREMIIPEAVVETAKNRCCIHAGAGGTCHVSPHGDHHLPSEPFKVQDCSIDLLILYLLYQ